MQHYIENRQPAIRSLFWWQQCLRTSCQSVSKTPKNICRSGSTDLLMMARHFQRKLGEEEKARGKEKIRPSFWLRLPSVALRSQPWRWRGPTWVLFCISVFVLFCAFVMILYFQEVNRAQTGDRESLPGISCVQFWTGVPLISSPAAYTITFYNDCRTILSHSLQGTWSS